MPSARFRVDTNNFSAQYGRNLAGVVTVLTKVEELTSSTVRFLSSTATRNSQCDAPAPPVPKTPYNQHRFGFTVGGPILEGQAVLLLLVCGVPLIFPRNIFATTVPTARDADKGNFIAGRFQDWRPLRSVSGQSRSAPLQNRASDELLGLQSLSAEGDCRGAIFKAGHNVCEPVSPSIPQSSPIVKAGLIPTLESLATASDTIYTRRDFSPFRQRTDEQLYKGDYSPDDRPSSA